MAYKTHICAAFDGIYACVCLCVKQNVTKNFFHASLSPLPSLSVSLYRLWFVVFYLHAVAADADAVAGQTDFNA